MLRLPPIDGRFVSGNWRRPRQRKTAKNRLNDSSGARHQCGRVSLSSEHRLPAAIVDLANRRKIQMYVSEAVLSEYKEVLNRSRLALPPRRIARFLATIRRISILVKPIRTITLIPDDPDNRLLECAQAANANYLITGNVRHFPARFQATKIVTPLEFIGLVYPALAQLRRESR